MDKKITIGTVCFIIDSVNSNVLLLERSREPMSGMLTGVGGKTNFDEDINKSCIREIKEETGLTAKNLHLNGIVKTILSGNESSWILFVYSTNEFNGNIIECNEGTLNWVNLDEVYSVNLIDFIREILPFVFESKFFEGTILHDSKGTVLQKNIKVRESISL